MTLGHASSGDIWEEADRWVGECALVVDRPRGSVHPRFPEYVYPLDYGYLTGTVSADGEGVDVFVGAEGVAAGVTHLVLVLDPLKRDAEVKLMVGCEPGEVDAVLEFYGGYAVAVPRP